MTIPEASQLVLQALGHGPRRCRFVSSTWAAPVKIVDLAQKPHPALRPAARRGHQESNSPACVPGEKLYEELDSMLEDTLPDP